MKCILQKYDIIIECLQTAFMLLLTFFSLLIIYNVYFLYLAKKHCGCLAVLLVTLLKQQFIRILNIHVHYCVYVLCIPKTWFILCLCCQNFKMIYYISQQSWGL